jgi:hypothetical protein
METLPVDTERGHKGQEDNLEAGMVQGEVEEAAGLQQRTQETKRRDLDPLLQDTEQYRSGKSIGGSREGGGASQGRGEAGVVPIGK